MQKWSTLPPASEGPATLPIERTPPKGELVGWITSHKMLGCPVHWYKGRTKPCQLEDCHACAQNVPWRWKGYLGLHVKKDNRHVLFEFPAQVGEKLGDYLKTHRSLRNLLIAVNRIPEKPNGKVNLRWKDTDDKILAIHEEPNLLYILSALWDIPLQEHGTVPDRYNSVAARINQEPVEFNGKLPESNH